MSDPVFELLVEMPFKTPVLAPSRVRMSSGYPTVRHKEDGRVAFQVRPTFWPVDWRSPRRQDP
jgi:hypothetical protein